MEGVNAPSQQDQALLLRGDPRGFDAIYAYYRPRLYGYLLRMSRRREITEELLQETFLRLAAHALKLPPDVQIGAWLFTVARNLYLSWRRWAVVDQAAIAIFERLPGLSRPTPAEEAAGREVERRLESALAALHERDREILLLVCVEGFEPSQAAAILGLSPEAARQRLSRARSRLAERLGGEGAEL